MCGICGFAGLRDNPNLNRMVAQIAHRGPDGVASYEKPGVGLGFARLAIMDLVSGMQPFSDPVTGVQVVVNGEIYNHISLRNQLVKHNYRFTSTSDSEVVLAAYLHWGLDAISKLEGMFALAIWDETTEQLVLARDRLGKKPLYFASIRDGIVFASEIKSILAAGASREVDEVSLFQYLATDSIPTPRTIFKGIQKLDAGKILVYQKKCGIKLIDFWSPNQSSVPIAQRDCDPLHALEESVKSRLMSDVPVGIFLSSGIDSTLIAALMAKNSKNVVNSFTLKFQGNYDESEIAKKNAKKFGFLHHEIDASLSNIANQFTRSVEIFDEPLNDPATLPMLLLSQEAKKFVKVVLTGDGGDELLIGYPHARLNLKLHGRRFDVVNSIPGVKFLLNSVPDTGSYFGIGFKAQRFARGIGIRDFAARDLEWRGAFGIEGSRKFLSTEYKNMIDFEEASSEIFKNFYDSQYTDSTADRWSWWYLRTYLMDTVLVKVDRATMASGIEARSPLLDHKFVESVLRKQNRVDLGGASKALFVDYLRRIDPTLSIPRAKHGMGVPVLDLLNGPLNEQFMDLTSGDFIVKQGIFSPSEVSGLVKRFRDSRTEIRKELWGLFVFQAWYSRWAS
jgi:asparagine synthase (glutamine-hydrolysing)